MNAEQQAGLRAPTDETRADLTETGEALRTNVDLKGRVVTKAQVAAASAQHAAADALDRAQDTAQDAAGQAHDAASRAVDRAMERAPEPVARSARQAADNRRPVLLGAVAVVLLVVLVRRHRSRRAGSRSES